MSDRAGYLNLRQPRITAEPEVITFTRDDGRVLAVVDLGDGVDMQIESASGARALAAAFALAADLLEAAGTEAAQ